MAIRADDVDLGRDRALVERFQAGDSAAFGELYGRYQQRLQRFCLKRVGDPHDAEEVVQEAFTRALRAMPDLNGERRFYPWVSVIAARLCVDHHRRRARTEPAAAVDLGVIEGGQDAVVDAEDADLAAKAFERLGPRHREVLQLREVDGWSYQHIADHYDVSLGTVEALLFRARRALRREFEAVQGGRLAALPFVGWIVVRLHHVRSRLEAALPDLSPLVANSLGAVFVVSSLVALSGGGAPAQPLNNVPAGPVAQAVAVAPAAASSGAQSSVFLPDAVTPTATSGGSGQATAPSHALGPLRVTSASAAQSAIDRQYIHVTTPVGSVGVDPNSAVYTLFKPVHQVEHQLGVNGW